MIVECFSDMLDLSQADHVQLAAILDNYSSMQDFDEEDFSDFFSIHTEG
jgi:uncharacterized protein YegL